MPAFLLEMKKLSLMIGMNPTEIGKIDELPKPKKIEEAKPKAPTDDTENQEEYNEQFSRRDTSDEETVLLNQEFLLDPELTVREFLVQNSLEVIDFVRFECGENLQSS